MIWQPHGKFNLGVDVENDFKPKYVLNQDKVKVVDNLIKLAEKSTEVYLATDPDREGEAISKHISERLKTTKKKMKRITFNAIDKLAISNAIKNARDINEDLCDAQETRRILDRIVGFRASPLLSQALGSNLSAGRVQSVALRMIVDVENQIKNFKPENYWVLHADLKHKDHDQVFKVKYEGELKEEKAAGALQKEIAGISDFYIYSIQKKDEAEKPPPPLTTAKLQQVMASSHGWSADQSMKIAQSLYEQGFVTYIRTDSTRTEEEPLKKLRDWMKKESLSFPKVAYKYDAKTGSQDAHECIRPTDVSNTPSKIHLFGLEKELYEVIWKQFVASQMSPAIWDTVKVVVKDKKNKHTFKASGNILKDEGFYKILGRPRDNGLLLPPLSDKDPLEPAKESFVSLEKKQTTPPSRFNEGTLIKDLEKKGIGRPATYASILKNILDRKYVTLEKKGKTQIYHPTELGNSICDLLTKSFHFMDYNYTKDMEDFLDKIAEGKTSKLEVLTKFYDEFEGELLKANKSSNITLCDKCKAPMRMLTNKKDGSKFLGCTGYPNCKNTKSIK